MRSQQPWLSLRGAKSDYGLLQSGLNAYRRIQKVEAMDGTARATAIQTAELLLRTVELRLRSGLCEEHTIIEDLRLSTRLLCKFSDQSTEEIIAKFIKIYRKILLQRQAVSASLNEKEQAELLATTCSELQT